MTATNFRTSEKVVIKFYTRGWASDSYIEGECFDSEGRVKYKVEGTWMKEIWVTEIESGERELLWKENDPIEDSNRMFGFNNTSVTLNFKSDEMAGIVAPTDTRFRGDQRLYEQGEVDAADEEKVRLEVKQRKARKLR
mmetsp:Transcript_13302/g.20792  ORF Transcript_13302/g.20792 Transcript_13302/m.20792 type:complete len:138 (+) Transcript_13302:261-674(+)